MKILTKKEKIKSNDSNVKQKEKEISSVISSKILDYKSKLDAVPVQLIPVEQSETDRKEVNELYSKIEHPSTQILDSKFYTQVLKMNRERDKSFLKEGTTRKERITILSQLITRVTTPILFLNHQRNIQLSNFFILDSNDNIRKKKTEKEDIIYDDPINNIVMPDQLTQEDILTLRKKVLEKTVNKSWNYINASKMNLSDWEADILSQLIRDEELRIIIDKKSGTTKIVKNDKETKDSSIISFLLEPTKKKKFPQ